MNIARMVGGVLGMLMLATMACGQTTPAADLDRIVTDLGSTDFARRDAAQRQLESLPPAQVELVRSLAAGAKDAEVKARLDARISEMEVWTLLHPPGISLNVTHATLEEVAAALGSQLGPTVQVETSETPRKPTNLRQVGAAAAPAASQAAPAQAKPRYTLRTDKAPFWKVMDALNRQSPLDIESDMGMVKDGCLTGIRLRPLHPDARPVVYTVADTIAYSSEIFGTRNSRLQVRVHMCTDPRVTFARITNINVLKKFTSEKGVDIGFQPLAKDHTYESWRPMYSWNSAVNFDDVPGLQRIGELRGTATVSLVGHRQTRVLDITKPEQLAPLQTPRGLLTLGKHERGFMQVTITPPNLQFNELRVPPIITVQAYDAQGASRGTYATDNRRIPERMALSGPVPPVKLVVSWVDKVYDYALPIEIHDLEIPDNPQPLPNGQS
jgi:hypothetical protein